MINTNGAGDAWVKYDNGEIVIGSNYNDKLIVGKNSTTITDTLTLSKSPGAGVKVDPDAPTYGWRDIIGDVSPKVAQPNAATIAAFRGGTYRAFFYNTGDLCFIMYHMPHDYVLGTDIFLHLHWGHNGTAISGQLVLTFGITYAKVTIRQILEQK